MNEVGMSIQTSISNKGKGLSMNQKHTINFQKDHSDSFNKELGKEQVSYLVSQLTKIFLNPVKFDLGLKFSKIEKIIIIIIFYKKYKQELSFDMDDKSFVQSITKIIITSNNKRPEEKLKFVFKRCFKKLINSFNENLKKKRKLKCSKKILQIFYKQNYTDIASKEGMKIEEFFPPNRSKAKRFATHKTLSLDYLMRLAKNPKTLTSMINDINKDFERNYSLELKQSFHLLVNKISCMITKSFKDLNQSIDKIQEILFEDQSKLKDFKTVLINELNFEIQSELKKVSKFEANISNKKIFVHMKTNVLKQKMKIPWSIHEVRSALKFVKKKLQKIQNKVN